MGNPIGASYFSYIGEDPFHSCDPNRKYFMLNPEEQDDPYLVFLRCTYTALNNAFDAGVYTSILAAVIGDIKKPLIK